MPILIKCPYCQATYSLEDNIDSYVKAKINKGTIPQSVIPCKTCHNKFYLNIALLVAADKDCELNNKRHVFEEQLHRYYACLECGKLLKD